MNFIERHDLISATLENLVVEIKKPRSKSILVSTWYRPPDSPTSYFSEFEKMIGLMDAENLEYFLLGDLNIDCLPTNNSPNRDKITEIFDIYGLEQMINEPTRITDKSSTLIDLCITNSPTNVVNSSVLHLSISDHSLVYMVRKTHYKSNGARIVEVRSLKNFSRENFLRDIELKQWSNVHCSDDPNEMWATWKTMLMKTIDKHAPCRSRRTGKKRSSWITNDLKRQMFKRDYLKKKAISSKDPQAWHEYRQSRNHVNNEIKKAKISYFTTNLDLHKGNMKKTWKLINEVSSKRLSKTKKISETRMGEEVITSPTEISEAFNNYFSTVGSNLASDIALTEYGPEYYLEPTHSIFSLKTPTVDTVYKLLTKIDEKKSVGLDNIPNKLLKIAADVIAPSLTAIFTASINTGIFPQEWKESRVSPVYKSGARNDPSNYRPISVIPVIAKIFEKIVYEQLYEYLNNYNLLTTCQSGFRSLHSTLTALVEATNSWSVNIDTGLVNGVVFIDLKKAFDTIDHNIILKKLGNYGVDLNSLKWFESYLTKRTQKCRVSDHLSSSNPVNCGVPQGSNLGPLLFLVYINDLPNCLNCTIPRMFADDTSVSYAAKSMDELQNIINSELENLHKWLNTNKLSLNIAKTKFMIIGSRQRISAMDNRITIEINDCEVEKVD